MRTIERNRKPEREEAIMADDAATPAPVKAGWKTSEVWMHLIVTVAGLVVAALPSDSKAVQIAGMVLSILSALGYTASRTSVKNAAQVLLVAALLGGLMSCEIGR